MHGPAQHRLPGLLLACVAADLAVAAGLLAQAVWLAVTGHDGTWVVAYALPALPLLHGLAFAAAAWGLRARREGARKAQVVLGALLFPLPLLWAGVPAGWGWAVMATQYALGGFLVGAGASLRVVQWVRGGPATGASG